MKIRTEKTRTEFHIIEFIKIKQIENRNMRGEETRKEQN